jgi:hypothetical protein
VTLVGLLAPFGLHMTAPGTGADGGR